jgi:hypothetical protein
MVDAVQVVAAQVSFRHRIHLEQVARQRMKELRLSILVDALVPVIAKPKLQGAEAVPLEETQHPAVEYQFLVEAARVGFFILW